METLSHNDEGTLIMDAKTVIYSNIHEALWGKGTMPLSDDFYISFKARSIGKVQSTCYLAIDCLNHNKYRITSYEGDLVLSDCIQIINTDGHKFILGRGCALDVLKNNEANSNAVLVFYFDDNFNRLPDYYLIKTLDTVQQGNVENRSAKVCRTPERLYVIENNELVLDSEVSIPDALIERLNKDKCYVRLHMCNGEYVYPLGKQMVPHNKWTEYTVKISANGSFQYGKSSNTNLRMDTKYIKVGFLANYAQKDDDAELLIKDVKLYRLV